MSDTTKKELIANIIYGRVENGDSCVETAENWMDDVKYVDPELYGTMQKLMNATSDMIQRLGELNDELDCGYDSEYL